MSKAQPDINDTLRDEGPDGVRKRFDEAASKANGKTRYKIEDVHFALASQRDAALALVAVTLPTCDRLCLKTCTATATVPPL